MPVRPDCHGTAYSSPLSNGRARSERRRLACTLGMLALLSFCSQPSRIMRAAIQPVRTKLSRSVDWHPESWFCTLPKNSSLSLTSSLYVTWMPVLSWNAISVGCFDSSFSSTSIYCGQLEKASFLSVLEVSSLTQLSSDCEVPSVPHAVRRPPVVSSAPEAAAPRTSVDRKSVE